MRQRQPARRNLRRVESTKAVGCVASGPAAKKLKSTEFGGRVADGLQADGDVGEGILFVLFVFERQAALVIDPLENGEALEDVEIALAENGEDLSAAVRRK